MTGDIILAEVEAFFDKMNTSVDELKFETKDKEIFRIPNIRSKLETLQNYFFPRLERLLAESLSKVEEVYNINPYEIMSPVYRPSHRRSAKNNIDFGEVHIGIAGKRSRQELVYRRKNGKHANIYDSYLVYRIYPDGSLTVIFSPFKGYIHPEDDKYIQHIKTNLEENQLKLEKVFSQNGISYALPHLFEFNSFLDAIINSPEESDYVSRYMLHVFSPTYYFPINEETGLWELKRAFVALYPLLESFMASARGEKYDLGKMLDKLIDFYLADGWYWERRKKYTVEISQAFDDGKEDTVLPSLESYRFIRAGLWWEILARDNWTCCSCGRSSKEHGIVLHVDHIIPRSKGGTNDKHNLQTLCWKCNIGKSNRDMTNLRNR